ncbi:MAG: beta-Ala-His dipeptidase [Clostridia bacterium]|nr:beta-Ala-His dipeptidase [Clostridia bacterium]
MTANFETVLSYFKALTAIPRGSTNRAGIRDYLCSFAAAKGLRYRTDSADNVVIFKPPAAAYAQAPAVILQGHTDMVCACADGCTFDFLHEPLRLRQEGDYLFAAGTSLGADDGIGVAMMLALLESDLPLPALECIFTADEEIGMIGASALDMSDMAGKYLINIDSENEGVLTVSCAGGSTAVVTLPFTSMEAQAHLYEIEISGLRGGHSGMEIDKGGLNANKLLGDILQRIEAPRLVRMEGGEKINAIARSAHMCVACAEEIAIEDILKEAKIAVLSIEPQIQITGKYAGFGTVQVMEAAASARIITALAAMPQGIIKMSEVDTSAVQTSLNLGIIEQAEAAVSFAFSLRSNVRAEREALEQTLQNIARAGGGNMELSGIYPAWEYQKHSALRDTAVSVFRRMYGYAPKTESTHAGLECGVLAAKKEDLECISLGPQMYDVHTAREKLSISSAKRTFEYLVELLGQLGK